MASFNISTHDLTSSSITATFEFDEWEYNYIEWYISKRLDSLFNVSNKQSDKCDPALDPMWTFYQLSSDTKYYIGVIVYGDFDVQITTVITFDDTLPKAPKPSVTIDRINRTSNSLSITITNTSSSAFEYGIYLYDFEEVRLPLNSGATETALISLDAYSDDPVFFYICTDYEDSGGEHFDWYYPTSGSTLRTAEGKRYALFKHKDNPVRGVKVDVTDTPPWDILYGTTTTNDPSLKDFAWAPYKITGHSNVYISTNVENKYYPAAQGNSSMYIEVIARRKTRISFSYMVINKKNTSRYLTIYIDGVQKAFAGYKLHYEWQLFSIDLETGTHVIKIEYDYDSSDSSNYDNTRGFFADFSLEATGGIEPWSWKRSNGRSTVTQVTMAYAVITAQGELSQFSYIVWNDMVDKVSEILKEKNLSWSSKYATLAATIMSEDDKVLTAARFNSLRFNIGSHYSTGINEVQPGDDVFGSYFITLGEKINAWIDSISNK